MKSMQEKEAITPGGRLTIIRGQETAIKFAARLGCHRNTLMRYESDLQSIPADVLVTLAAWGYEPSWVVAGTGEPRLGEVDGLSMQGDYALQIGARLALLRGEESQVVFAQRLGIHRNSLSRYELGDAQITGELLRNLYLLGWNLIWILTGEGSSRAGIAIATNLATVRLTCSDIATQISLLIEHLDRPSRTVLKNLITSMNLLNVAGKELEAELAKGGN